MNNKILIAFIIVALVIGGGVALLLKSNKTPVSTNLTNTVSNENSKVKAFSVTSANFSYDVKEIRVKKGDTVRITLNNSEAKHDLKIDEFNVSTKLIGSGETDTIEFLADKAGQFDYYCTIPGHREAGMKGILIVE